MRADVKNGDRVLISTRTASLASMLETTMSSSEIVGVDPSFAVIAYAKKNAKSSRTRLEVGNAQALWFQDGYSKMPYRAAF